MTIQEFYDRLARHDWFYHYSDDRSVWTRGVAEEGRLSAIAKTIEGGEKLMDDFSKHHFSGEPWSTLKQPRPEKPT